MRPDAGVRWDPGDQTYGAPGGVPQQWMPPPQQPPQHWQHRGQ